MHLFRITYRYTYLVAKKNNFPSSSSWNAATTRATMANSCSYAWHFFWNLCDTKTYQASMLFCMDACMHVCAILLSLLSISYTHVILCMYINIYIYIRVCVYVHIYISNVSTILLTCILGLGSSSLLQRKDNFENLLWCGSCYWKICAVVEDILAPLKLNPFVASHSRWFVDVCGIPLSELRSCRASSHSQTSLMRGSASDVTKNMLRI